MRDAFLQDRIGRETDGVRVTFCFEEHVDLRFGKGGIAPEIAPQIPGAIALENWPKNQSPILGAMDVART